MVNINKCFCFSAGRTHMKCYLDKNSYTPGEEARLNCSINNSNCSLAVQGVEVVLVRELSFKGENKNVAGGEGNKENIQEIFRRTFPGVPAGQTRGQDLEGSIFNLKIENSELEENSSENKSIQPTVSKGQMIKCKYHLKIELKYEGSCLKYPNDPPVLIIPVTIFAKSGFERNISPMMNGDFKPHKLEAVPVVVSDTFYYRPKDSKKKGIGNEILKTDAAIDVVDVRNDNINLLGNVGSKFKKLF